MSIFEGSSPRSGRTYRLHTRPAGAKSVVVAEGVYDGKERTVDRAFAPWGNPFTSLEEAARVMWAIEDAHGGTNTGMWIEAIDATGHVMWVFMSPGDP